MSRNSVTGRFRDLEISFNIEGTRTYMSIRNLISDERQVSVMYQKLAMSGLANWRQFQLTNTPISLRLPAEILEAYRLTFFVDDGDPISARLEKILAELDQLRVGLPAADSVDANEPVTDTSLLRNPSSNRSNSSNRAEHPDRDSDIAATQQVGKVSVPHTSTSVEETAIPNEPEAHSAEPTPPAVPEKDEEPTAEPTPRRAVPKSPAVNVDNNLEFKITVPSQPPSALAKRRKAQALTTSLKTRSTASKHKKAGIFGQFAQALGFPTDRRHDKAYYQAKGEAIQDDFQDKLSKLEKDYNEGYGLDLSEWDQETLCEEETAILLLNLMVSEVTAWQKEVGRATPETQQLVETLTEVGGHLRQTLKQTRGVSSPSPTLFPDLLAENQLDLEKIQNECDAYLQRFTKKLIEQEKKHAAKIEVIDFKKFLIEFVRDFLFLQVTKSTAGSALPKRLTWFLDLVDSEIMPIEIGKTKVSSNHHKVKGACSSDFEPGTIVEIVTPGLQSKDGKRVSQMAVVIEAE